MRPDYCRGNIVCDAWARINGEIPEGAAIEAAIVNEAPTPKDMERAALRFHGIQPPDEDRRCSCCGQRMPADVGAWIPVIAGDVVRLACDRQCAVELEKP